MQSLEPFEIFSILCQLPYEIKYVILIANFNFVIIFTSNGHPVAACTSSTVIPFDISISFSPLSLSISKTPCKNNQIKKISV